MEFEKQHSQSLKQNLKTMCAGCCNFCNDTTEQDDIQKPLEQSSGKHRSLSSLLKSELARFFSYKKGRNHRRSNSSEFKYDALSYALNFEDDDSHLDEYPLRDFASRLPPSPVKHNNNNNNNSVVVSITQKSNWS